MGERKTCRAKGGWCVKGYLPDRVTLLMCICEATGSSKRGLGQFSQANSKISEGNPKTVLPMVLTKSGKTPATTWWCCQ